MKRLILVLCLIGFKSIGQSVLSTGDWIRVAVKEDGVYKITKDFLAKNAPNLNVDRLRIFCGHSSQLPQSNSEVRFSGLREVPTLALPDGNIAFYGFGAHKIFTEGTQYKHLVNPYSDENYYFITSGVALPIENQNYLGGKTGTALPFYTYEEKEKKNLLNSGQQWLGDFFNNTYELVLPVEDFVGDYKLGVDIYPLGIADQELTVRAAGAEVVKTTLKGAPYNANDANRRYQRITNRNFVMLETPYPALQLHINSGGIGNAGAYVDYWSVTYQRKLKYYSGRQIIFRTNETVQEESFKIEGQQSSTGVWHVADPFTVKNLVLDGGGSFSIPREAGSLVVFDSQSLPIPAFVERVKKQNLENTPVPEVLVVFPEAFRREAESLIAYKRENEDFEILGFSAQEIYNEYSSGKVDPTAIRDFCRNLHLLGSGKLKHLLLLGDATFDYKNNNGASYVQPSLLIPTYQSRESFEPIYSYASDDYFGFLDESEGEWAEGYSQNNIWVSNRSHDHFMDIAVGRIPARSASELNNYIQKYINYKSYIGTAKWQNKWTFVADNRDYNLHMRDTEELEDLVLETFGGLETQKLYLDDFPIDERTNTAPEANKQLHDWVNQGSFLVTYVGHGAADGLTSEKLLTLADILNLRNPNTLPIWFTATCEFGRFDNPGVISGAELSVLRQGGGAIALLTTTRAVYSTTNQAINRALFKNIKNATTLGELFRITKNESQQGEVNRNFSLLGDPTLLLPNLTSNQISLADTLRSIDKIQITGSVADIAEGKVWVKVMDVPKNKNTLGTFSDGPAFAYKLRSESIYSGVFIIKNHQFEGEIVLPPIEIDGYGRVVYSFGDLDTTYQGFSFKNPVYLTSQRGVLEQEQSPPTLHARVDDSQNLVWEIGDETGIVLKDLVLHVGDVEVLNAERYFEPVEGSKKGLLKYPIGLLSEGSYTSVLAVSDVFGNRQEASYSFEIKRPKIGILAHTLYPNPVIDYANLQVRHNRTGENLEVKFLVFDVLGREIFKQESVCSTCPEEFGMNFDFLEYVSLSQRFFYRINIKSESDGQSAMKGGILFSRK